MRVEHGGHWAEISEKPLTWAQRNVIRSAAGKDFWLEFAPIVVTSLVTAWSEDGDCTDREAWDPVDPDFADKVFGECVRIYKEKAEEADVVPTAEPSANS